MVDLDQLRLSKMMTYRATAVSILQVIVADIPEMLTEALTYLLCPTIGVMTICRTVLLLQTRDFRTSKDTHHSRQGCRHLTDDRSLRQNLEEVIIREIHLLTITITTASK